MHRLKTLEWSNSHSRILVYGLWCLINRWGALSPAAAQDCHAALNLGHHQGQFRKPGSRLSETVKNFNYEVLGCSVSFPVSEKLVPLGPSFAPSFP